MLMGYGQRDDKTIAAIDADDNTRSSLKGQLKALNQIAYEGIQLWI